MTSIILAILHEDYILKPFTLIASGFSKLSSITDFTQSGHNEGLKKTLNEKSYIKVVLYYYYISGYIKVVAFYFDRP